MEKRWPACSGPDEYHRQLSSVLELLPRAIDEKVRSCRSCKKELRRSQTITEQSTNPVLFSSAMVSGSAAFFNSFSQARLLSAPALALLYHPFDQIHRHGTIEREMDGSFR